MDWRPEEVFQLETPPACDRIRGDKVGDIVTVSTQLSAQQQKDVEGPMAILKYISNSHRRVLLVENIARSAQTHTKQSELNPLLLTFRSFKGVSERGFKGKVH